MFFPPGNRRRARATDANPVTRLGKYSFIFLGTDSIFGYFTLMIWHISVQDNGIGISNEHLPHIFEHFYRVDRSRSKSTGGSGIGLALVKLLVEAHDGKVHVASAPGEGSTLCAYFPAITKAAL